MIVKEDKNCKILFKSYLSDTTMQDPRWSNRSSAVNEPWSQYIWRSWSAKNVVKFTSWGNLVAVKNWKDFKIVKLHTCDFKPQTIAAPILFDFKASIPRTLHVAVVTVVMPLSAATANT